MENGFINLWRKSTDSQVFQDAHLWKVWTWCLMKASYKERWFPVDTGKGVITVKLLPGQFIFGRETAAKELKMPPSSVRDRMKKLKNMQNLDIKPDMHYSLITVINWEAYQGVKNIPDSEHDSNPTATRQQPDTNNKVDKVKKVNKRAIAFIKTSENQNPSQSRKEYIEHLMSQYQQDLVQRVFDALPNQPVSDDRKLRILRSWEKYPVGVGAGIEIYLEEGHTEHEGYLLAIIKRIHNEIFTGGKAVRQDDYAAEESTPDARANIRRVKGLIGDIGTDIRDRSSRQNMYREIGEEECPNCHQWVTAGTVRNGRCIRWCAQYEVSMKGGIE